MSYLERVLEWERLGIGERSSLTLSRIFQIESNGAGRVIPVDYLSFLAETNGCSVTYTAGIEGIDDQITLDGFHRGGPGLASEKDWLSDWVSIGLPIEDFLRIGSGSTGIFVMRVIEPSVGEISWWSNDAESIVKVADSFTEFFNMIGPLPDPED
jgi:hypothetical protein